MYTASFAFFEALWQAGITYCFVNLGSDHPSIIEAMVKGQKENKGNFPRIITCPNEMVALSMADGYARLSGKPQCVIIHVDVGTQGLGAAVHNASTGRAPVFIFAGLSPFTLEGEMRGSRTEYIHWMQDVPDQKQIVAQYCRYTGEIKTGTNIKQMVNRALQFARSDPQGPVYLLGAREVMEQDITPYSIDQSLWDPVELGGLPPKAAKAIAEALLGAEKPLLVTGYSGRNHKVPDALVELANTIKGLRVLDAGGSDMCFPASHPSWLGLRNGGNDNSIREADAILILNCDVPWMPTQCKPKEGIKIFHIDVDPLKYMMPVAYVPAQRRYRADALVSVEQIIESAKELASKVDVEISNKKWDATVPLEQDTCAKLCGNSVLKTQSGLLKLSPIRPTFTTNVRPELPGSWINCGGGGLGWSGGGALGIKLASAAEHGGKGRRYQIPVLTIVLNNKGWNAPRKSLMLVHPDGQGAKATNEEINISFDPVPDFSGIAKAAAGGDLFAAKVEKVDALEETLKKAIEAVEGGQSAVIDCKVNLDC
ncbi:hypothetical protein ONZ43_g2699 [Nemania bipapillata]|uniref:Uncharacterized protein n=1 Tax=Nemania bipapillata TaxID=110536 RepID=A0ACC2IZY1_9PEZI|nr:hypothetical protein ONZ43_g2699 [Nemania bipapillata]